MKKDLIDLRRRIEILEVIQKTLMTMMADIKLNNKFVGTPIKKTYREVRNNRIK